MVKPLSHLKQDGNALRSNKLKNDFFRCCTTYFHKNAIGGAIKPSLRFVYVGCYTELHSVKSIHGPRNLFRLKTHRFRRFKFSSHIEIFLKSVIFVYPTKNYELLFRSCDHYLITEMADLPYFVFYKWLRLQGISFPFLSTTANALIETYCLSVDVRVLVSGISKSVDGFGSNFQGERIDCILSTSSTAEGAQDNFGPRTYSHNWRKTTRFGRICRHGDAGSPFWESALLLHEIRPLTSAVLVFNSETKHFPISVLCGSNRSTPDKDSTRESKTRIVYSCPWLHWILIDFLN